MDTQGPPECTETEISNAEKLFWIIDGLFTKAVPFLLGLTVLYILIHLANFL